MGRRFEPGDINRFASLGGVALSPRGDMVALTVAKPDTSRDRYDSRVWILDADKGAPIYVTQGPSDAGAVWSPRGDLLAYHRVSDDRRRAELRLVDVGRGTDFAVAELPAPPVSKVWLSENLMVVALPTRLYEEEPGVHVIRSWPLWFNGRGFVHNVRLQLYAIDTRGGVAERVTRDEYSYTYIAPHPRGDRVLASVIKDPAQPYRTALAFVSIDGGYEELDLGRDLWVGPLAVAPSGRLAALFGRDNGKGRGFAAHVELWILDLESGGLRSATRSLGLGVSRRVYYDLRGPASAEPRPVWVGDEVYFPLSKGGRYSLYRYSTRSSSVEPVIDGDFVVWEFDAVEEVIAFIRVGAVEPAELWIRRGGSLYRLTRFNVVIEEYEVSHPHHFTFRASDGAEIEGWVLEPVGRKEGEKYPAILWIHGGPKSKFGWSFMFEFQLYASHGYAVVYCNPRGSDGYGEEFADIRGRYGERDFKDLMECVDFAVKSFGFIDPERLGVTGISYGGFMTNWIITHTDRFRAAITQNSIASWEAEYLTTDIGPYFVPDQIGGDPWKGWERLREKSPLYYVDNVRTPLMIIHSIDDYRCWLDQAISLFTALKLRGREVELVLFESGGHVFGWTGKPSLREARLRHMLRWFNRHLKEEGST